MAFNPILDSSAEVIHQPMLRSRERAIHSHEPEKLPKRDGFITTYWGRIVSSSLSLFNPSIPINSSSRAIGIGVFRHRRDISSHCPWRMGCSIEWISYWANCSSFRGASSGEKAPLASTRSSISSLLNCDRIMRNRSNSASKSIAPIFNLMQWNPASNFLIICWRMESLEPIQIKPLISTSVCPSVKGVG